MELPFISWWISVEISCDGVCTILKETSDLKHLSLSKGLNLETFSLLVKGETIMRVCTGVTMFTRELQRMEHR